ncbi:MAG TPA: hypothetical protein PKO45_09585 [Rubrivivax sp.]|nr:hypothetical protein [Burkholderiales bacterium]HNT39358.1 hypothetical protein [Rubrivivax sp.]
MAFKVLNARRAADYEALCDLIVPGSSRIGPATYTDAALAKAPAPLQDTALQAIDALADARTHEALAAHERSAEFALVRALAVEAFCSDFVAPGAPGPGAWTEMGFEVPRPVDLERDWSWLGIR